MTHSSNAVVGEYSTVFTGPNDSTAEDTKILLVDDSRVVRKVFSAVLSQRFKCVEAGSFDEAIRELKKQDFAVVIADIIMPGLSGIELLRKVLQDFPGTEVIIVSGVDRPQRALDAVRLGAFDYLIKPCDTNVLEITVERALERRRLVVAALKYKADLETKNAELINRKEQLERLQTRIVQSEKMASLGQLSAGVAHELNNPVGFVHANLEILDRYVSDLVQLIRFYDDAELSPADASEAAAIKASICYPIICDDISSIIRDCCEGSDRIREIVQNLRTFSRLDEAEYKDTNIHEGIEATAKLLSKHFLSGNIKLVRSYGDLPSIGAFPGPLNQVWMNLLANAAQAIARGSGTGQISITTTADNQNVYVEIADNGCGIAIQHVNRIFDPFFTTKPIGEGTGLGLSISFGIVQRHGGSISVNSRLNEGTSFKVTLPLHFEPEFTPEEKAIACYSNF